MNAPNQGKESQAGLCSLQAVVEPGRMYRLRLPATDTVKGANPRAMVAQVRFLDAGGEEIVANYAGCFASERYGQFVYLASSAGLDDTRWSEQVVTAPDAAASIKVVVHAWKASPALEIQEPLQVAADSDSIFEFEAEVSDGLPYRLNLSLADAVQSDRAAVVCVRYVDAEGKQLPGPYRGCYSSPRFGQYFYASASEGADRPVAYPLFAPAGATRVLLAGYRWKGKKTLALGIEPRLECSLLPGRDQATDWLAIGPDGRDIEVAVPSISKGHYILLQGQYVTGTGKAVLRAVLRFHDQGGSPVAVRGSAPEDMVAECAFRLAASVEERPFQCFSWCPPGAASATLRIVTEASSSGALVHRDVTMVALNDLEAAARMKARLGVAEQLERRFPVQPEWRARLDFEALQARNALERDVELRLSFEDAQGRTLQMSGSHARHSAGSLRNSGSSIVLKPDAGASGDPRVALLRASLQILPPPDAHTLTVGLQDAGGSDLPYACTVEPCDALAEDRLEPRSAAGAVRVESHSPEAARLMVQRLLDRHPDDPAVLGGAIDVYRRLGDADQLEAVASRALAAPAAGGKLKFKARHVLASLQEMDPDWCVEVPGKWNPAQKVSSASGLRVAHLFKTSIPYENTGGAIRCMNIVKFQKKMGMDPFVVTPLGYPKKNLSGAPWEREDVDGIPHYRLNGLGRDDLKGIPSTTQLEYTALLTANLLREQGIDLVQASSGYRGYEQALVGLAISRKLQVPFVYEVRSYHEHTWRQMADWILDSEFTRRRMAQEDRCMRDADAVVTICETMKLGLIERGVDEDKIFVIPNGVDTEQFQPTAPDQSLKDKLGLSRRLVVGYISNLSEREGHRVLLHAVAKACAQGEDIACLIVGNGPQFEPLKQLADSLDIADRVVMTGDVPHHEIPAYYAMIDVFVVPRIADFASDFVTPMKPFEAMGMGCPVIISDLPALREVVEPGVRGLAFEQGDAIGLAGRIVELSRNPQERKRLSEAGVSWVNGNRTWEMTVGGYEAAYAFAVKNAEKRMKGLK